MCQTNTLATTHNTLMSWQRYRGVAKKHTFSLKDKVGEFAAEKFLVYLSE